MGVGDFDRLGWCAFPVDLGVQQWAHSVAPMAITIAADPAHRAQWLRHGETWFVGVNILPNDGQGAVPGGPPLQGVVMDWLQKRFGPIPLDRAQISVNYPGYPQQDPGESDANHRFRRNRDAAHVDGVLPIGPQRRRYMREPHAYVVGLPLTPADDQASPMVIWEGSHHIMAQAFADVWAPHPPETWGDIDITEAYHAARRTCFETCPRRVVHVPVGGAYVVHRLALHGVAPWADTAQAHPAGRIIAYFRPELPGGIGGLVKTDSFATTG
ncbi:MAG: hypothetical protein AAF701_08080 [Pseudomonadota bacterium]